MQEGGCRRGGGDAECVEGEGWGHVIDKWCFCLCVTRLIDGRYDIKGLLISSFYT
jgi:hypothetical protein